MAREIEAKFKVDTLDLIRKRLLGAGAARLSRVLETNTFFDTPDHRLLAEDKGVRVRRSVDLETGRSQHVMTYKGPREPGPLKQREEIELRIDDHDAAIALLERLGFRQMLSFEKRRETWTLRQCKVELDELPHLGTFVEIEGPSESDVLEVRDALDLTSAPMIRESYSALVAAEIERRHSADRSLRFS